MIETSVIPHTAILYVPPRPDSSFIYRTINIVLEQYLSHFTSHSPPSLSATTLRSIKYTDSHWRRLFIMYVCTTFKASYRDNKQYTIGIYLLIIHIGRCCSGLASDISPYQFTFNHLYISKVGTYFCIRSC